MGFRVTHQYCGSSLRITYNSVDYDLFLPDINECATGIPNCSADAVCNNTMGSYRCICKPGYYGDGENCQGILKTVKIF